MAFFKKFHILHLQLNSGSTTFNATLNLTGHILLGLGIASSLLLYMFFNAFDSAGNEYGGYGKNKVTVKLQNGNLSLHLFLSITNFVLYKILAISCLWLKPYVFCILGQCLSKHTYLDCIQIYFECILCIIKCIYLATLCFSIPISYMYILQILGLFHMLFQLNHLLNPLSTQFTYFSFQPQGSMPPSICQVPSFQALELPLPFCFTCFLWPS